MATGSVRSRSSGLSITLELEGFDRTAREFRAVRARIKRDLNELERKAAQQEVLPSAKRNTGGQKIDGESLSAHLVVRKRSSGAYLTTNMRGIRARAAGLVEFGGTVRTPIVPKHKGANGRPAALLINGSPRATVRTARHYRARRYLQHAAEERLNQFGEHVRDGIVDFFGEPFTRA